MPFFELAINQANYLLINHLQSFLVRVLKNQVSIYPHSDSYLTLGKKGGAIGIVRICHPEVLTRFYPLKATFFTFFLAFPRPAKSA